MNTDTAREDLAFMRALVQPDEAWQRQFGEIYLACGLCYGGQMLMHAGQMAGLVPYDGTIKLDAVDAKTMRGKERARTLAYVPQEPTLPPEHPAEAAALARENGGFVVVCAVCVAEVAAKQQRQTNGVKVAW